MNVTYRLFDGRTWTFAKVSPDSLSHVCAGIASGYGFIDVESHGRCLSAPDESELIRICDVAAFQVEVAA